VYSIQWIFLYPYNASRKFCSMDFINYKVSKFYFTTPLSRESVHDRSVGFGVIYVGFVCIVYEGRGRRADRRMAYNGLAVIQRKRSWTNLEWLKGNHENADYCLRPERDYDGLLPIASQKLYHLCGAAGGCGVDNLYVGLCWRTKGILSCCSRRASAGRRSPTFTDQGLQNWVINIPLQMLAVVSAGEGRRGDK